MFFLMALFASYAFGFAQLPQGCSPFNLGSGGACERCLKRSGKGPIAWAPVACFTDLPRQAPTVTATAQGAYSKGWARGFSSCESWREQQAREQWQSKSNQKTCSKHDKKRERCD